MKNKISIIGLIFLTVLVSNLSAQKLRTWALTTSAEFANGSYDPTKIDISNDEIKLT